VLAVVDSNLRVHGTDNLWVADNSIVPAIPAGHTAGTAVIIGEKAAELVTPELGRRRSE
jgi:choline dehydrogenase